MTPETESATKSAPFRLSKSRIAAFEQCPKRLWLMIHRPELGTVGSEADPRFAASLAVGALARGQCHGAARIEAEPGLSAALATTRDLLERGHHAPVLDATFDHDGVLVRIDILEPHDGGWRVVEVTRSTKAKPGHDRAQ